MAGLVLAISIMLLATVMAVAGQEEGKKQERKKWCVDIYESYAEVEKCKAEPPYVSGDLTTGRAAD